MQLGQHDALKPYETLSRLMAATKRCLNSFEHCWRPSDPSQALPYKPRCQEEAKNKAKNKAKQAKQISRLISHRKPK